MASERKGQEGRGQTAARVGGGTRAHRGDWEAQGGGAPLGRAVQMRQSRGVTGGALLRFLQFKKEAEAGGEGGGAANVAASTADMERLSELVSAIEGDSVVPELVAEIAGVSLNGFHTWIEGFGATLKEAAELLAKLPEADAAPSQAAIEAATQTSLSQGAAELAAFQVDLQRVMQESSPLEMKPGEVAPEVPLPSRADLGTMKEGLRVLNMTPPGVLGVDVKGFVKAANAAAADVHQARTVMYAREEWKQGYTQPKKFNQNEVESTNKRAAGKRIRGEMESQKRDEGNSSSVYDTMDKEHGSGWGFDVENIAKTKKVEGEDERQPVLNAQGEQIYKGWEVKDWCGHFATNNLFRSGGLDKDLRQSMWEMSTIQAFFRYQKGINSKRDARSIWDAEAGRWKDIQKYHQERGSERAWKSQQDQLAGIARGENPFKSGDVGAVNPTKKQKGGTHIITVDSYDPATGVLTTIEGNVYGIRANDAGSYDTLKDDGKHDAVLAQIKTIEADLERYREEKGKYPRTLKKATDLLEDPWGKALGYVRDRRGYRLRAWGANGKRETEGGDDYFLKVRIDRADPAAVTRTFQTPERPAAEAPKVAESNGETGVGLHKTEMKREGSRRLGVEGTYTTRDRAQMVGVGSFSSVDFEAQTYASEHISTFPKKRRGQKDPKEMSPRELEEAKMTEAPGKKSQRKVGLRKD